MKMSVSPIDIRIVLVHIMLARTHGKPLHGNGNVVILRKFSSLAALEVVILTTSGAASDDNCVKMTTFPVQYI